MTKPSASIWNVLPANLDVPDIGNNPFWQQYVQTASCNVHVAIIAGFYMSLIFEGKKTIEARFSVTRRLPYKRVYEGDVVLLKRVGYPIEGIGYVAGTRFFELEGNSIEQIRNEFGARLAIRDEEFWQIHKSKRYLSLIELNHVIKVPPLEFKKRDRNAWLTFDRSSP